MSAVVTVDYYRNATAEVPLANYSTVDKDGNLSLTQERYGDVVALFKAGKWEYVVITPARDSRGRFVKRGA